MPSLSPLAIKVRSDAPDANSVTFSITAAVLSETLCQTLFYGIYLTTCVPCCRTICLVGTGGREKRWRRLNEVHWLMAVIAFALFVLSTFDIAIGWLNIFQAFVRPEIAISVLTNFADWIQTAQGTDLFGSMLLWDFVLVYRCWIVYGRQWTVMIPSAAIYLVNLALAGAIFGIAPSLGNSAEEASAARSLEQLTLGFYGTVAVQNILTTSLLVWRIWRVERKSIQQIDRGALSIDRDQRPPRHLRNVIRVLSESGATYTTLIVITLISSATSTQAVYPISSITFQMTGIAFNMMLVRTSPNRDEQFTTFEQDDLTTIHAPPHRHHGTEVAGDFLFNPHKLTKPQEVAMNSTQSRSNFLENSESKERARSLQ
ncbi:hypothetical protein NP233_g3827 [Leucocoprinus birnbaumii]|uniref:Uncharacterized protein n=1 Tax=Leucocoprinus birnbaumii TaxID=56174 RepID=A0AAD5VZQ8_9AGAR|nr:hypothetical protein NP233_g3827 [Leucocoprinus birnbaumii]